MGRAHSRTSACVSAQHAPTDRADPTTWTWFMSCLLPNGVHRLQTLGEDLLTTLPDAGWQPWPSWSDSRHCQKEHARVVPIAALLLKKMKNHVSRPETLFFVGATNFRTILAARGVERFAPGAGAICPRGWGKSLHPPQGVFFAKMSQREGLAGVRKRRLPEGLRSLGLRFQHRPDQVFVDALDEIDLADLRRQHEPKPSIDRLLVAGHDRHQRGRLPE